MSDTYTGWDGNAYPWPPPDGWYEASDGQWWAPGTGPNPPQAGAAPSALPPPAAAPSAFPPPGAAAPQAGEAPPAGYADDGGRTAQLPTFDSPPHGTQQLPGAGAEQANLTIPAQASHGAAPSASYAGSPQGTTPGGGDWDAPAGAEAAPARGKGGVLLLSLVGVLAALAVAGGAFLFLRDDTTGDETAATEGDAADDAATTTFTTTEGDQTLPADSGDTADGGEPADGSVIPDGETTTTVPAEESSSSEAETTESTEASSTTALTGTEVQMFRDILADNGLTSTGLSDDQISTFGTTFCIFATASESETEYVEFREQAIAETESDLTPEELFLVIDAAVVVFCPEQANRLGISL